MVAEYSHLTNIHSVIFSEVSLLHPSIVVTLFILLYHYLNSPTLVPLLWSVYKQHLVPWSHSSWSYPQQPFICLQAHSSHSCHCRKAHFRRTCVYPKFLQTWTVIWKPSSNTRAGNQHSKMPSIVTQLKKTVWKNSWSALLAQRNATTPQFACGFHFRFPCHQHPLPQ